jgi:hypothetical protein
MPPLPPAGYVLELPNLRPEALPFYRFRAGIGLLSYTLGCTRRGKRMFPHWSYPDDAAKRRLPFYFGNAALTLEAEGVVLARCSQKGGSVPVLAFTLEGAQRSKQHHALEARAWQRWPTRDEAVVNSGAGVYASAPKPHDLALMLAIAQAQYRWSVKRPHPPDTYQVRTATQTLFISCRSFLTLEL